jgi:hypothetical protein
MDVAVWTAFDSGARTCAGRICVPLIVHEARGLVLYAGGASGREWSILLVNQVGGLGWHSGLGRVRIGALVNKGVASIATIWMIQ